MMYSSEVQEMCVIAKGPNHGPAQKLNVNNYFVHNNQRTRHNSIVIQWING